jgi:hypothetical protein
VRRTEFGVFPLIFGCFSYARSDGSAAVSRASSCKHGPMGGRATKKANWVTAVALSCMASSMVLPAWASPPFSRPAAATVARPPHLDLRPPSPRELDSFAAVSADHPSWARPRTPENRDSNLPALGADAGETRVMGRAESFVRRFHREGLPVARLWETHSALLSLGLNGKGKPGLWLVQKTH